MTATAFCFDNEQPAHQVFLNPVRVSPALVTNGEWLDFMADGGLYDSNPMAVGWLVHGRSAGLGTRPAIGARSMVRG